ncbi:MAG: hypothetical protein ACOCV2_07825, partial [Persicimonas sp.]
MPDDGELFTDGGDTVRHSLALDDGGCPHITFHQRHPEDGSRLFYARWDGDSWHKEVVTREAANGYEHSLAIDSDGNPSVAHEAENSDALMYSRRTGVDQWETEEVDDIHPWDIEQITSADGQPAIAVVSASQRSVLSDPKLLYFHRDAGDWNRQEVFAIDETLNLDDTPAFDDEGRLHLGMAAGQSAEGVFYGRRAESGSWDKDHMELEERDIAHCTL